MAWPARSSFLSDRRARPARVLKRWLKENDDALLRAFTRRRRRETCPQSSAAARRVQFTHHATRTPILVLHTIHSAADGDARAGRTFGIRYYGALLYIAICVGENFA